MADQMVMRGICRKPVAPIWAWHSCGSYRGQPRKGDINSLFGNDGRTGVTIKIDAPDWLVLLSAYGPWNDVIDDVMVGEKNPHRLDPVRRKWSRIFDIERYRYSKGNWRDRGGNHYDVQACLPFIEKSWVLGVRPFRLPDLSYSAAIRKSLRLKTRLH